MRIDFRQGIIRYPDSSGIQQFLSSNSNFVDLIATSGSVDVTFAHRESNYLLSESSNVELAWGPFPDNNDYWLYWDINLITGERTFGFTELEPLYGTVKPTLPAEDQHWFDTIHQVMMVYKSGAFREVVRVFAAKYASASIFQPLGNGVVNFPFAGSQVALNVSNLSGYILFDSDSKPLIRKNKQFVTSENQFFISGTKTLATRLESNVIFVQSTQSIAKFHVVKIIEENKIAVAGYDDIETSVLGMITEDVDVDSVTPILLQGKVVNIDWNFTDIGAKLWVKENGELSLVDPHVESPNTYPEPRVPIARVISTDSIIFEQGLGGTGKQGPPGTVIIPSASITEKGGVFLSISPTVETSPIAVGTNDPRMTDQRSPLPHIHIAADITNTSHGDILANTVQNAIEQLEDNKLSKTGGVVNGDIQLNSPMAAANSVVNKSFVESIAYQANEIVFTPTGSILSEDVQAAIVELDGSKLSTSGGTMDDFLSLHDDPILPAHAVNKQYVDTKIPTTLREDLRFFMKGLGVSGDIIDAIVVTKDTTLPQDLVGSVAVARIAPTIDSFFDIMINGIVVGNILISNGNTQGTFTFLNQIVLSVGDVIQVVSPFTVDATMEDVSISISSIIDIA